MGSKQLNKFISNNDKVFLNIHGHTHDGDGLSKLGKTNIFNPGSLTKGNFGIIKLKKDYKNIWKCEKIEIINLDF
jgi:Icc-related predicted phosphoesterase